MDPALHFFYRLVFPSLTKKSEPRLRFLNRMICFADPLEGRFQILFEFVFQFLHVPSIKTRCCTENAVHLELTKKLVTQSVIHDDELIPACKVRIVDKNNGTVDMFNGVAGIDVKLKGPDSFGARFCQIPQLLDFFLLHTVRPDSPVPDAPYC